METGEEEYIVPKNGYTVRLTVDYIIQAIMEHQDFIMLDEPMRGLDKEAQQTFYEIIQELHEEGKTVIIASHDVMDEIEFDRKLCVENGKIMEL